MPRVPRNPASPKLNGRVGSNRLIYRGLPRVQGSSYWLQAEELKGTGLEGREFREELKGV